MGRKLKSPTRTISNRGDRPRFIGYFPCRKGVESYLVFDSLSSLFCGLWLEWRLDIFKVTFEAANLKFEATDSLPALEVIPDYQRTDEEGEIGYTEAKYSPEDLTPKESEKICHTRAHMERAGYQYEVVYRSELEKNGLISTILLLRPYAQLSTSSATLEIAQKRLAETGAPATLHVWRARAKKAKVPVGVLYQLIYQQRLGFVPEPLTLMEFLECQG